METSTKYLLFWCVGLMISTSFQTGFVLGENNQTAYIFTAKKGWDKQEEILFNTLLSTTGIFGIAIGSIFGSVIVNKIGLRNTMLAVQITNIIANVMKIVSLNIPLMIAGRVIFGLGTGINGFAFGKSLNEYIPQKNLQYFGLTNNIGINMGIMVCGFVSLLVPLSDSLVEEREADEYWRVVNGCTIVF